MPNATMPALVIGHGSPMNALELNAYTQQMTAHRHGAGRLCDELAVHGELRAVHGFTGREIAEPGATIPSSIPPDQTNT